MLIRFPTGLAIISIGGIAFSSFTANYTTFTIASHWTYVQTARAKS